MKAFVLLLAGLAIAGIANAQSVSLNVGDSTLYGNTLGGGLTYYTPKTETTLSVGSFNGHILPGVTFHDSIHGWDSRIGNQNISLNADGGSVYLPCICATTSPSWRWFSDVTVFAGATGAVNYYTPFSFGEPPPFHLGIGFQIKRQITDFFELNTLGVVQGSRKTALENIRFLPNAMTGLKNLKQHVNVSATFGWINGYQIRNGLASVNGKQAGASFSRSTFVLPQQTFTSQNENGFVAAKGFQLSAGLFQGTYRGKTAGLGWNSKEGMLRWQANYYQSSFGTNTSYLLGERLRKFTFTETASHSSNGWQIQPGGGYAGNRINISVNPSESFNPLQGKWVRTWSISLSINQLPHDSALTVQTITLPSGQIGYTGYLDSWLYGRGRAIDNSPKIGKFLLSGHVRNEKGEDVEGAAIQIDNITVYSDVDGNFELMINKNRSYRLRVITNDFLLGDWSIVKSPPVIEPGTPVEIIVERSYGIPMPSR